MILLGILNAQAEVADAGSYDLLETTVLSSDASSVTFTGLGSYTDYKHLQLRYACKTDRGSAGGDFKINFNGDTTSVYSFHLLNGNGSSVASFSATSTNRIGYLMGQDGINSNTFAGGVIDILDPFSTSKNTTTRALTGSSDNVPRIRLSSGLYISTSAISSISFAPDDSSNIVSGSRVSLYGIRAA